MYLLKSVNALNVENENNPTAVNNSSQKRNVNQTKQTKAAKRQQSIKPLTQPLIQPRPTSLQLTIGPGSRNNSNTPVNQNNNNLGFIPIQSNNPVRTNQNTPVNFDTNSFNKNQPHGSYLRVPNGFNYSMEGKLINGRPMKPDLRNEEGLVIMGNSPQGHHFTSAQHPHPHAQQQQQHQKLQHQKQQLQLQLHQLQKQQQMQQQQLSPK